MDYHSELHLQALNDSFHIFLHLFDDTLVHVGSCLKEGEEMSCRLGAPKRKTRKGESKSIDTSPYKAERTVISHTYAHHLSDMVSFLYVSQLGDRLSSQL